jgi:hypothetical protein
MEESSQLHAPAALPPGERASNNHWIGGCRGPRVDLGAVEKRKLLHCWESNPSSPARSLCVYIFLLQRVVYALKLRSYRLPEERISSVKQVMRAYVVVHERAVSLLFQCIMSIM